MDSWGLLLEIVILLAGALLLGGVASKLGQSPLIGYLMAGMVMGGPGSLGIVQSKDDLETIAELGVSLLLFSLGLEFSWKTLKSLGHKILLTGIVQVVVTLFVIAGIAIAAGFTISTALGIGAMLSLSSTAAVLRILTDIAEIDSPHGRNSVAILLVQDMAVVPLALLMLILRGGQELTEVALGIGQILILSAVFVLGLYLILRVSASLLGSLDLVRNREATVLLAVVVGLGSSWAAHAVGLSPALGAFVAGIFLGSSPFATLLRSDISSLKVVLLTLFFVSVGMIANPRWIAGNLPEVLLTAVVILVVKFILIWGILRSLGWTSGVAFATALTLSQVGEFAFVLGMTGTSYGLIDQETYTLIVSVAILTLFVTPYSIVLGPQIGRWLDDRFTKRSIGQASRPDSVAPDVLIIGFGPAGQAVGRALDGRGNKVLVIDLNPTACSTAGYMGLGFQIGDAQQTAVLEHASVHSVKVVVIAVPSRTAALSILDKTRALAPQATVIVRSRYHRHSSEFKDAGAFAVVDEEEEVGRSLAEMVLEVLGEGD